MTDIADLQARELELLNDDNNNDEVLDLEALIVDGANSRIAVEIDFPFIKEGGEVKYKKYGAIIRPLQSREFTNATQLGLKNPATDVPTEVVKVGLCTKNGDSFPPHLVEKLPAGVVVNIFHHICEVSGIETDEEGQDKLIKEMLGF